jgi:hypothetical protein
LVQCSPLVGYIGSIQHFPTLADNIGPILVLYWPTYALFPMWGRSWLNNDRSIVLLPWLDNVSKHWYNVVLLLVIFAAFNIFRMLADNSGPILVLYWPTYALFPIWGQSWLNNDRFIVFLPWLGNVSKHWYNVILLLVILAAFNIFPTLGQYLFCIGQPTYCFQCGANQG